MGEHRRLDAHELGVVAHAETVRIHPFVDGNGRATRFLADLVFAAAQDSDSVMQYDSLRISQTSSTPARSASEPPSAAVGRTVTPAAFTIFKTVVRPSANSTATCQLVFQGPDAASYVRSLPRKDLEVLARCTHGDRIEARHPRACRGRHRRRSVGSQPVVGSTSGRSIPSEAEALNVAGMGAKWPSRRSPRCQRSDHTIPAGRQFDVLVNRAAF